ncbi:MAG TPA: YetF domain-containing protein [Thermoanaerobaculia bacterium]|jgi:uncharacterized membrane protein YcaP (DUF421 family)
MGPLLHTFVAAVTVYVGLSIVLRLAGKRTLATLHVFDFVIVIALGSTMATIVTSKDISAGQAVIALAVPVSLELLVAYIAARSRRFEHVATSTAVMLVEDGQYLHDMMLQEAFSEDEVNHAIRRQGLGSIGDVAAVVLEPNGELTVVARGKVGDGSMLANIPRRR